MQTLSKVMAVITLLILMTVADIPLLPVELVAEAQAILGVRRRVARRTAVVAYSAGATAAATTSVAAASTDQHQAPPPPPQQPASVSQPVSTVPLGTTVHTLPGGCTPVTVSNVEYHDCGGSFYRTAFQGNSLAYVVVEKPI